MPAKPTRYGIKVWCLAEADSGYMCTFDIYLGREENPQALGLAHRIVLKLAENYANRKFCIVFDNFFTSVNLMLDLLANGVYSIGTFRPVRKFFPEQFRLKDKMTRGESKIVQCGNLTAVRWFDNRDVFVASTISQPSISTVRRQSGQDKAILICPLSVVEYNKYMSGVDLSDQFRSYYNVCRASKKYWRYIFWFLFEISIINSFIIWKTNMQDSGIFNKAKHTQKFFRMAIAEKLMGSTVDRKRARPSFDSAPVHLAVPMVHKLISTSGRHVCEHCRSTGRKTGVRNRTPSTKFICQHPNCRVYLCRVPCYQAYHISKALPFE